MELTTHDGLTLFGREWQPAGDPKAVVCIVHGFGEHSGRYEWAAGQLTAAGYAVYAVDLRGHGQSPGRRAYITSFNEYLRDTDALVKAARAAHPGKKLFILGHSMGGGTVALYAIARKPGAAGIILSGPALQSASGPMAALMRVGGRIAPGTPVRQLAAAAISRDPEVVKAYNDDPLVYHGKLYLGLIAASMRRAKRIARDAHDFTYPLLVVHGQDDSLCPPADSSAFVDSVGSPDKTIHIYPELYHEVLNEPEKDRVMSDILAWLDAH